MRVPLAFAGIHHYPTWTVAPFALLLLSIAVLPLLAPKWWNLNRSKALVGFFLGVPAAIYVLFANPVALGHTALEYLAFLALIGSLFTIAGGVEIQGKLSGRPAANTALLATGAVLANLIGTTGASMLLIRPYLRANRTRQFRGHLVVFFIFTVSNIGGMLTPLGDPPLFLGFLHGVPFTWTLQLWKPWAIANGLVLAIFLVIEIIQSRREAPPEAESASPESHTGRLRIHGASNLFFLLLVVGVVFASGRWIAPHWGSTAAQAVQIVALVAVAGASLASTPQKIRKANDFSWHPFVEVAVLFAAIFAAMIPALGVLQASGAGLGVREPWQFFWATGGLSALLDNAPTYLAFLSLSQFLPDEIVGTTYAVLAAISCGAVLFGALTYIGNGPNFMVKAIAEHSGVRMPSFFGYMAWSCAVLLPVFLLLTFIFFRA